MALLLPAFHVWRLASPGFFTGDERIAVPPGSGCCARKGFLSPCGITDHVNHEIHAEPVCSSKPAPIRLSAVSHVGNFPAELCAPFMWSVSLTQLGFGCANTRKVEQKLARPFPLPKKKSPGGLLVGPSPEDPGCVRPGGHVDWASVEAAQIPEHSSSAQHTVAFCWQSESGFQNFALRSLDSASLLLSARNFLALTPWQPKPQLQTDPSLPGPYRVTIQSDQSVGCDDYLGSDKVVDKCGVCGGDNTGCQVVSGVVKHALTSLGYHRVVEIPQGATKINITEMHKSNNYLASGFRLAPGRLEVQDCFCPSVLGFAFCFVGNR
ncbi:hypothetical protein CB1_000590015 [Camelus ferus]|nr:hypothetical protein CB1_000590015 [Camelus ferus]